MRISGGKLFTPRGFRDGDLYTDGERIAARSGDEEVYDAQGGYVLPGLTDLHFHGAMGGDFSDGDPAGLQAMADYELSQGVTQICPAGMTLLEDQLTVICKMAAQHNKENRPGAMLVGVNLEGPFLSYAKKGAQNGDWLHKPDAAMLRRLMAASEGLVKLVSVAPEEPGGLDFVREVSGEVGVSVGHTTADYDTAMEAYRLGARQATHLFNAMPAFTHRAPGVVGAALDSEHCMVELISDGVHIHPAVVRAVFRMYGAERVILISDSLRCTGMPDGKYPFGGQEVMLKGNRCTLAHEPDTLAGSVTNLMECVRKANSFGVPLVEAVTAAAVNPAKALGIDKDFGTLEQGKMANFVVLDEKLALKQVFFRGKAI